MVTILGGGIAGVHGGEMWGMGERRGSGCGVIDGREENDWRQVHVGLVRVGRVSDLWLVFKERFTALTLPRFSNEPSEKHPKTKFGIYACPLPATRSPSELRPNPLTYPGDSGHLPSRTGPESPQIQQPGALTRGRRPPADNTSPAAQGLAPMLGLH